MRKTIYIFSILLFLFTCSTAKTQERFVSPSYLSDISQNWAYSLAQDRSGAIWISTNNGVFRYNGHSLQKVLENVDKGHLVIVDDHIYAKTTGQVCAIDVSDRTFKSLDFKDKMTNPNSVLYAERDSLYISIGNAVYVLNGSSASLELMYTQTRGKNLISAIHHTTSGKLLVGTGDRIVSIDGDINIATNDQVLAIADAPEDNTVYIGLKSGGLCVANLSDRKIVRRYDNCNGKPFLNIRSFATSSNGDTYFGGASGLYKLDCTGFISEIFLDGKNANPVYEVMCDRDGNIWVGTCYSGVFYANITSNPFRTISQPGSKSRPVRGFAQDARGTVWAATDAFGMYKFQNGEWIMLPESHGIKHQCIMYDGDADVMYAGDWVGNILRYTASGKMDVAGKIDSLYSRAVEQHIVALDKCGKDIVLATLDGAFLFDPATEKLINRKIKGTQGKIRDVKVGPDGRIWLAGQGLSYFDGKELKYLIGQGECVIHSLDFSTDGTLWCATDKGVASIKNDTPRFYSGFIKGASRQSSNYAIPVSNHLIAVGTNHGLSIFNTEDGSNRLFEQDSGISFKSTSSSSCMQLSGGIIWLGGIGGIEAFDTRLPLAPLVIPPLVIDELSVNGTRVDYSNGNMLKFNHLQTNYSFDLADFDFSGTIYAEHQCMLEGIDKDWKSIDIRNKIEYMNLKPGRYTFRVRTSLSPQCDFDEISQSFRICYPWYASPLFICLIITVLLTSFIYFVRSRYVKTVLIEKIRLMNEEYKKQTWFFIKLSYKMRTPLNLIIGQLEQYFKEYGARGRGIEDIQEVYGEAKDLREMISEYVDTQNESLEQEPHHAKTINAVLGAVERNLFTKELNVSLLCEELNMGKTKLTEVMKKATGMTPGEFIEDVRLRHATQMLNSSNYTITEIADRLGFSSANYFSVRFKKKFGVSPSRFCADARNKPQSSPIKEDTQTDRSLTES